MSQKDVGQKNICREFFPIIVNFSGIFSNSIFLSWFLLKPTEHIQNMQDLFLVYVAPQP